VKASALILIENESPYDAQIINQQEQNWLKEALSVSRKHCVVPSYLNFHTSWGLLSKLKIKFTLLLV